MRLSPSYTWIRDKERTSIINSEHLFPLYSHETVSYQSTELPFLRILLKQKSSFLLMVVLWNTKAKTGLLPAHIYLPSCSSFFPDFSGFFIIQVDLITKWQGQETRSSNPNWWVCLTLLINFLFFPLELPPFGFSLLSLSLCGCSLLRLLCHDYTYI